MNKASATLYYFHDPMCSWCYGFSPTWQKIKQQLAQFSELSPVAITVQYVAGGLAADSNEPMPVAMATYLQTVWRQIEQTCGVSFNYEFWQQCQPRRSTYPACRAVIAAGKIEMQKEMQKEMIVAIQNAYYQQAQNPSDTDTLIKCATMIGLDATTFLQALQAKETEEEFQRQLDFTRQCSVSGFPALQLHYQGVRYEIPVRYDGAAGAAGAADAMVQDILNALKSQ